MPAKPSNNPTPVEKPPPRPTQREQIVIALAQVRGARHTNEPERELYWQQRLDELLDEAP